MPRVGRIAVWVMAVVAGVTAAYLVFSGAATRRAGSEGPDYYCYELREGWVCTYARPDCEARVAREAASDVKKRCQSHDSDTLTP